MRFLVDENLPFSLIQLLEESGHDVLDVAASHLRGEADERLWKVAAREGRILITKDLGFHFPHLRPSPPGLVVVRVPDTFTGAQITRLLSIVLRSTPAESLEGWITVISPGRVRLRRLE